METKNGFITDPAALKRAYPEVEFQGSGQSVHVSVKLTGEGIVLFDNVKLHKNVTIHKNTKLMQGVTIGNGTFIGLNVLIEKQAVIGIDNTLCDDVRVGHDALTGRDVVMLAKSKLGRSASIDDAVRIETNCNVKSKASVGARSSIRNNSIVGTGATVEESVILDACKVPAMATVIKGARYSTVTTVSDHEGIVTVATSIDTGKLKIHNGHGEAVNTRKHFRIRDAVFNHRLAASRDLNNRGFLKRLMLKCIGY